MSILRNPDGRTALRYLGVALFAAFFSVVYECLSHDVRSPWMVGLAAWPLLGGTLPFWLFACFARGRRSPGWLSRCLYHSGLATLTVASCVTGVFEIYGSASAYTAVFWLVGAALVLAGLGCMLLEGAFRRE